nr:hypothetical protein [Sneathiella chungangensis]
MGYRIIANVLRAVTAMTVKIVSLSLLFDFGNTAEIAKAAEAPQMATAPPVKVPKRRRRPRSLERRIPTRMVAPTPLIINPTGAQPRETISLKVSRIPSSATPKRNMVLEEK